MKCRRFLALVPLLGLLCGRAFAQAPNAGITVDEYGVGTIKTHQGTFILPSRLGNDPGPGGLNGVLIYNLPFAGVQGDVLIPEPGAGLSDVVRFNGDGTLIFYSDIVRGDVEKAPADTLTPPGSLYENTANATEIGTDAANGALYTPMANNPGFDGAGVTYNLISDGHTSVVPEPGTLSLLATGGLPLLGFLRRRRLSA